MKARRNRIRQHKRRPRIRMESTTPTVAWIGGSFVDIHRGPRLRERFRILGWIFRLLRR